jgi:hypothetical protein
MIGCFENFLVVAIRPDQTRPSIVVVNILSFFVSEAEL